MNVEIVGRALSFDKTIIVHTTREMSRVRETGRRAPKDVRLSDEGGTIISTFQDSTA